MYETVDELPGRAPPAVVTPPLNQVHKAATYRQRAVKQTRLPTVSEQQVPMSSLNEQPKQRKKKRKEVLWDKYRPGLPPFPPFSYRIMPDFVAWVFGYYGYAMGKAPWVFLVFGLTVGMVSSAGIKNIQIATDGANLIDQFLELGSRTIADGDTVKEWRKANESLNAMSITKFGNDDQEEDEGNENRRRKKRDVRESCPPTPCSVSRRRRAQTVIIEATNGTLATQKMMDDVFKVAYLVRETLLCDLDDFTEQDCRIYCCSSWDVQRMKAEMFKGEKSLMNDSARMLLFFRNAFTYPAMDYPALRNSKVGWITETVFTNFVGGVKVRDRDINNGYNARVEAFAALQFQYFMPANDKTLELEQELTRALEKTNFPGFYIRWETHMQTSNEFLTKIVFKELPKVAITFVCVILWCTVGALHTDALTSKPWCGIAGILCTAFACTAGFGVRFWQGAKMYTHLVAVPLMALAIGLDDMFILMNNWHNTKISMPRSERAKRTLMDGGTSIFVTVMMTIIDFVVGTSVPYEAIKTYSEFALWTLAFDFILQITIFVSILVLTDGCEKRRQHSCCCCLGKVLKRTPGNIEWTSCHTICCTYGRVGVDSDDSDEEEKDDKQVKISVHEDDNKSESTKIEITQQGIHHEFENDNEFSSGKRLVYLHIAPYVLKPLSRIVIAIIGVTFLVGSVLLIWSRLKMGFHPSNLTTLNTNTYYYQIASWKYFRDYSDFLRIQVLVLFPTKYYDDDFDFVKNTVVQVAEQIEMMESRIWGKEVNKVPMRDANITFPGDGDENSTRAPLTNIERLFYGVQLVANQTKNKELKPRLIEKSTSLDPWFGCLMTFQMKSISELEAGADMSVRLRRLQSSFERKPNHHMYVTDKVNVLRMFDQIVNLPEQFVYFTLITVASTVVTALVMIPHPICIFWMSLSSMSITTGTLAGMALWGVRLDPVSLIYILMGIGATADYICHCIYTFTILEVADGGDSWATIRYKKARLLIAEIISETGPAACGTTLSIVVLSTAQNDILLSFFRVFFVAVIVGLSFMLLILPVILCQFGPVSKNCCEGGDTVKQVEVVETEYYYYTPPLPEKKPKHVYENNAKALALARRGKLVELRKHFGASAEGNWDPDRQQKSKDHDDVDSVVFARAKMLRSFVHDTRKAAQSNSVVDPELELSVNETNFVAPVEEKAAIKGKQPRNSGSSYKQKYMRKQRRSSNDSNKQPSSSSRDSVFKK